MPTQKLKLDAEDSFFKNVIMFKEHKKVKGLIDYDLFSIYHNFELFNDNYKTHDALGNVMGKLDSMRYHYANYLIKEKEYITKAKAFQKVSTLDAGWIFFPTALRSEFEAFLFQSKACMDIFSKATGTYYGQTPSKIKKLIKLLAQLKKYKSARKIETILKKEEHWLKDFYSQDPNKTMRDIITHYGSLKIDGIIVDNRGKYPLTGKAKRKQVNKSRYKQKTLEHIMRGYYNHISSLVFEVFTILRNEFMKK